MSLSMIYRVPINRLYSHPVTDNVWTATKYSTPHLGSIVVSGRRVVYTIITMRITYETFHNILCSILMAGQSNINITPNIYIYVKTWYLISMTREMKSSVYSHNSLYVLLLSHITVKLDYGYFKNSVIMFNGVSLLSHT